MKLVSVNVAEPKLVEIRGQQVLTGIYKLSIQNEVWVGKLSLVGDGQADKSVHGGEHQAVYCYPLEHYEYWQTKLTLNKLPYGTFGENFTVTELSEDNVFIGDVLKIGDSVVQVTMPRVPCFKFGHKIGRPNILEEFLHSGRSGFYLRVLTEGYVKAGDEITILSRDPQAISVRTALILQKLDLSLINDSPASVLKKALAVGSLAPLLKDIYTERLSTVI